jgi:preprotein translocase subunit YajC
MEMLWLFGPVVLVMIVVSIFSGRKQRKQKDAMLASLRKHDRVVTTSGLIGFVSEVKQDTVVLKIEEGRDVRLTFTRDAIAAVVKAAPAGAEASRSDE